jgi:hypothetical protein
MQKYITCVSCGDVCAENEIKEIINGNAICIKCSSCIKENTLPKEHYYDESKRPKFKYEDKYGSVDEIYSKLLMGYPLIMDGHAFEYFCADILLIEGFSDIKVTKASADDGVDIVAKKNNETYIFQCKCLSHTCSNKAVQEIVSANTIYKADKMGVICNNKFSTSAKVLANTNKVELYSIGTIKHILDKYSCDFYEI